MSIRLIALLAVGLVIAACAAAPRDANIAGQSSVIGADSLKGRLAD